MGILVNGKHADRLRQNLKLCRTDDLQVQLYKVLVDRVARNTREEKLVQSGDTQEWYHLAWERMADASFVYYMERDERLGKWIHDRTMEIVNLPLDSWIGPYYRYRNPEFQVGALESAHITLSVCEAYDNAADVFTAQEKENIRNAVIEKGIFLCRRFADYSWRGKDPELKMATNWHIAALNGYGVATAVFGVEEERAHVLEKEAQLYQLFNKDSYGESVQYSNYAALGMCSVHRALVNAGYAKISDLHPECYFNLMEWYAYSFQRMKYLESFEAEVPRTFAFGDSSNLFRPTADVLVQTAIWGKESHPTQAALASWLFQTIYSKECGLIDEMASFGFFNQFTYDTLLRMPDMASPRSPKELNLPLMKRFEVGHVLAKDEWEDPNMQIAIAAGYEPINDIGHRHFDQNSFQLTVGDERMLVDPGHCCYRLKSQKKSVHETSHNLASILYQGELLEQRAVEGQVFARKPVYNKLIAAENVNGITVVISDGTDLYPAPVKKAVRIWLMRLPDMVLVIDAVSASEPVKLVTRVVSNNRDNRLEADDSSRHQLFLKRKNVELSIQALQNLTDGEATDMKLSYEWSYLHEYYHPLPNQKPQGREGSALVYVWEDTVEAKEHVRVQLITPGHKRDLPTMEGCFEEYQLSYKFLKDGFSLTVGDETKKWHIAHTDGWSVYQLPDR